MNTEYLPIEIKTTGQMADELSVAELKKEHGNAYIYTSIWQLREAITRRVLEQTKGDHEKLKQVETFQAELKKINQQIWDLVDINVAGKASPNTGKEIQELNAKRRNVARQLDQLLGNRDIDNKNFSVPQHATV